MDFMIMLYCMSVVPYPVYTFCIPFNEHSGIGKTNKKSLYKLDWIKSNLESWEN